MASVMQAESEVFGGCVDEINVSLEIENREACFAVGENIRDLF
jgi:hypothetical protein